MGTKIYSGTNITINRKKDTIMMLHRIDMKSTTSEIIVDSIV